MPLCGTTFDTRGHFRGLEHWNKPTPTLRNRSRCAPLLPRSGFSGELYALDCGSLLPLSRLIPGLRQLAGALIPRANSWDTRPPTAGQPVWGDNSILQALPHRGKQIDQGVGIVVPGNG